MSILPLTPRFVKKATARLAAQLTLGDAIDRVTYALRQQGSSLADTVATALADKRDAPMDRRRARQHMAKALTGDDAPVALSEDALITSRAVAAASLLKAMGPPEAVKVTVEV